MDEKKAYQDEIGQYSFEKLQDIAEHIDQEQFPKQRRMVRDEMTERQLNYAKRTMNTAEALVERPIGIAILAWLHIIVGVLGGIIVVFFAIVMLQHPEGQQKLKQFGMPPSLLIVGMVFLFGLGLASGIGMKTGKRWGWHLGSFYFLYGIARNVSALIWIPSFLSKLDPIEIADMSHGPSYYYIKHSGRIIFDFLLYIYFFKRNVRAFFGLTEQKKWKVVVFQLGICMGILLFVTILRHFMI